jgi:two-component system, response regulator RegA
MAQVSTTGVTNGMSGGVVKLRILIVDDDAIYRDRLLRAMVNRGLEAYGASNPAEALARAREVRPKMAVVDLRMPGGNGIDLVRDLVTLDPAMKVILLTGYGSIASAVDAVKHGAVDYLQKPCDADQILTAFGREREGDVAAVGVAGAGVAAGGVTGQGTTPSLARVEWEHIQRILSDCNGNISQAARMLGIHRRSLQRKLSKLPPFE